jgi:hypothetical protein
MTELVNFDVKINTKDVDNMIKRYGNTAVTEYRRALKETNVYGLREVKKDTPVRTGNARGGWKWGFTGNLISLINNEIGYVGDLDSGWSRTSPIVASKAKALVFQVGKKTASKSSTETLYKRYKNAMKALKGKGLNPKEKAQRATQKSGVVVCKRVNKPASFKGRKFIQPVVNRIGDFGTSQVLKATDRILK